MLSYPARICFQVNTAEIADGDSPNCLSDAVGKFIGPLGKWKLSGRFGGMFARSFVFRRFLIELRDEKSRKKWITVEGISLKRGYALLFL